MKKYFYSDGVNSHGPYTLDELKQLKITSSTLIWYEGLPQWTPASNIPEISSFIPPTLPPPVVPNTTQPPPPVYNNTYQQPITPPKTYLVESILVTLFCCLPFGIAGIVNAANVSSKFAMGDYAGAEYSSNQAKKWMNWGLLSAIIGAVLYFFLVFMISI